MSKILIVDLDDTLLRADPNAVKIWKRVGETEIPLTTREFALDPESKTSPELFDIREFRIPQKAYHSIARGTPIIPNLRIVDSYVNNGFNLAFLTARSCETSVKRAFRRFMRIRGEDGELRPLGKEYKVKDSHAVSDVKRCYPGGTAADQKALILRELCQKYDEVVFIDDDVKNVISARNLHLPNLTVLVAMKEGL